MIQRGDIYLTIKKFLKKFLFKKNDNRYPDNSIINKLVNKMLTFLVGFFLALRNTYKFGFLRSCKLIKTDSKIKRDVLILTIVKDEGLYLEEWIQYHINRGVKGFIIYDNESADDTKKIIDKYKEKIDIDYTYWKGKSQQKKAYQDAADRYKNRPVWLLTIDADEFIVPVADISITDWVNQLPKDVSQVLIGWLIYGSNGHINRPKGLVIENYSRHAPYDYISDYKSLVRPDTIVNAFSPHMFMVVGKTIDESGERKWYYPYFSLIGSKPAPRNIFRINHYYNKSLEDLEAKIKRGDAFDDSKATRTRKEFEKQDRNEESDALMIKYIEELTHQIKK